MQAKLIVAYGLIALGVIILIWTGFKLAAQKRFVNNAEKVTGVIVGYEYSDGSRIQRSQDTQSGFAGRVDFAQASPIISFQAKNGETVKFISSSSSEAGASEKVELLYDPQTPKNAQLSDFFSLWGWIYIISMGGTIMIVIGVMLIKLF